jgi:hypothetical protein
MTRASGDADAKALSREGARDRSAEPVPRPDDKADAMSLPLAHRLKPKPGTT